MNKYASTDKDIHKRIYSFVIKCFEGTVKKIPKTVENNPLISQLSASLTSVGANDREADACGSRKDFIAKYLIVRKEANETIYWLSLASDLRLVPSAIIKPQISEAQEILRIVSAIIRNAS